LADQSAMATFTRTITVAAGVYAPGHAGGLTRFVPFDLVDAVLAETGAVQQRLRLLPSRVGVYFVLMLGLFPRLGYARVWDRLVAGLIGLPGLHVAVPSEKALRDLRRRVGVAPMRALFEVVAGPLAQPRTPGVRYRGLRTVAFDGCSSIKAPDAERSRSWLGKIRHPQGWAGYPSLMLMALVETGTRGLLGARFGPVTDTGETGYAHRLLHPLTPDMLLLTDRGFDSNTFLHAVADTGAQFLTRITAQRRPTVLTALPDGSYLTTFAGLPVRVIEAAVTVTTSTGQQITGEYRLATTLLQHRRHPAETLLRLYHERWEIESAFYALRHTLLNGRVLRSTDPTGLHQELWGLLITYQALRLAMLDAVETRPGTNPDRASFTIALQHATDQVVNGADIIPDPTNPLGVIGTAVLAGLLPERRDRISVRKVKTPTSRYARRPPDDHRPDASTPVTGRSHTIHPRRHTEAPRTALRHVNGLGDQPTSIREHCIALLNTQPTHNWHLRDIAARLPFTSYDTCKAQVALWTRQGHLQRTGPGRYTTPPAQTQQNTEA
jgi:Insertion element 4 transposase N-terminal/Transposase DDE domain